MSRFDDKIFSAQLGKIPPQAVEMEESILGAIMLERDAIDAASGILNKDDFYKDAHQLLFKAILQLYNANEPIDIKTVTHQVRRNGELELIPSRAYFISELTTKVNSAANLFHHARIVKEMSIKRRIISITSQINNDAYEDTTDIFRLIDKLDKEITGLYDNTNDIVNLGDPKRIMEVIEDTERAVKQREDGHVTGIPSGFPKIDKYTGGFQDTDLIIVAGRPGSGKTAFVASIMNHLGVHRKTPVAMFSLEMAWKQIQIRILSMNTEITSSSFRNGNIQSHEWQQLIHKSSSVEGAPIYIDDTASMSITEMKSKAKALKKKYGIKILFVDYIQIAEGHDRMNGRNREQEISEIARGLKHIAKTLNIPVIALSQLSRAVETRGGSKRPILSDLRESGCLSSDTSYIYSTEGLELNRETDMSVLSMHKERILLMDSKNIPRKPREVFRLKLQSGRYIDCTSNHPILTSDGYKELHEIKSDDSIACALNFPSGGKEIRQAKFIGWMIGNGCMYKYNVPSFITYDKEVADAFCEYINNEFGFMPKTHPHYQSDVYQYDCTNSPTGNRTKEGNPVTDWLKNNDLWGNKAKNKRIPSWFMRDANEKSVIKLLEGLWETDGSVPLGIKDSISYSTTSYFLGQQILYLLAKIGIFAFIDNGHTSDKATTPCYKVIINNYKYQKVFIDKINLTGSKGNNLKKIRPRINSAKYIDKFGRSTTEKIYDICRGIPSRFRIQLHDGRRLTKPHFTKIINFYESNNDKRLSDYKWLISDSIVWDTIESIKSLGIKDIFDRHVPISNNFIANGIIVHNSIEQEADIVIFLYRPEYYGISQDENGRSLAGLGEVIFAKNRHGALGSEYLKFIGKYTKWDNEEEPISAETHPMLFPDKKDNETEMPF